ncbi:MAG: helix-turn-helix domain-containing protein [Clostridia bacterium]|nr:helix-turn-helix domain-containing protein [Clostridia bacterium]
MTWLENIKRIKKMKGWTNDDLCTKSELSLGTINKLFAGQSEDPKLSTLMQLAKAFDMPLDEMLGLRENDPSNMMDPDLLKKYVELDKAGRETVDYIINKEYKRILDEKRAQPYSLDARNIKKIKLFEISASAGTGIYLSDCKSEDIPVFLNPITEAADFAVRVRGDSMMPKYKDGDIILAEQADQVDEGELGLFSLNGEGYFKKFGGDCLISLNPQYEDIDITPYDDLHCFGRVVGRLKK